MNLMSKAELMQLLRIDREGLSKLEDEGLPETRVGNLTRYDQDEVRRWMEAKASGKEWDGR